MNLYYDWGAEKRLNEIVMAGSHDAGITKGGGNAMTQKYDIYGQALAGVRLFDLRIAGAATSAGGQKQVELQTYHGPLSNKKVRKEVVGMPGATPKVVQSKVTGTFGETLVEVLDDARTFVTNYKSEFLILKFDKCKNWAQIAQMCDEKLGDTLYKGAGNVNKKTLFELKGSVIVVFTDQGIAETPPQLLGTGGILAIRSLTGGGNYVKDFNGIQYCGKGGTDLTTRKGKSIDENYKKQLKLMQGGAAGDRNVMGMMYWTTTGLVGNIRSRNKMMWNTKHTNELIDLWQNGMGDSVKQRIPGCVDTTSFVGGTILKRFMPNFVMIDFASPRKCQTIYDLNRIIPQHLTDMEQLMVALDD